MTANVIFVVGQFAMLSVLAHSSTVREVGLYAAALAVTAPVFILADLRLNQLQATVDSGAFRFSHFVAQRLWSLTVALATVGVIAVTIDRSGYALILLAAMAFSKCADGLVEVAYGQMIRAERTYDLARLQALRVLVSSGLFCGSAVLTGSAAAAAAAGAVGTIIFLGLPLALASSMGGWRTRDLLSREVATLTRMALALGIAFFIGALTVNVPRYVIEARVGAEALALFAVAAYVVVVVNTMVDSGLVALLPRLSAAVKRGDRLLFVKYTAVIAASSVAAGLLLVAAVWGVGGDLLSFAFGSAYRTAGEVATVLSLAATFQYLASSLRNSCIAFQWNWIVLPVTFLVFSVVVGMAFWLTPDHGIIGAAWAYVAGQACAAGCYVIVTMRLYRSTQWHR